MLKVVGLFVLMASALSKELDGKPSGGGTVQQRLFKPEHDEESRFSVIKDEEVNANETKNESSQGEIRLVSLIETLSLLQLKMMAIIVMVYKCSVKVNFRSFVIDHLLHLEKFNVMF